MYADVIRVPDGAMHGAIGWAIRRLALRLARDGNPAFPGSMPDRGFSTACNRAGRLICRSDPAKRIVGPGNLPVLMLAMTGKPRRDVRFSLQEISSCGAA
jgi:hypothetical protein